MTGPLLLLLFGLWFGAVVFLRYYRVWLFYYVLGAVGAAYFAILIFGDVFGLEPLLAHSVAWSVHVISNLISIPTRIFEGAPGVLLVLVIIQEIGWTVLQVGIESSALLEIGVLSSLLLFYPGWTPVRRARMILLGGGAIWLANILRMLVIVIMLNQLGKEALVLAHMYVGKFVFFILVIVIFWFLVTKPTLKDLHQSLTQVRPAV